MFSSEKKVFASYNGEGSSPLLGLCQNLLTEQKALWPELAAAYADLDGVRVREIPCDGFSLRLQFNPRRIVSSAARVDPESILRRKCFLCLSNLPPNQQGIRYRSKYLILCNPAPIFPLHYTVTALHHIPQSLEGHLSGLLLLAEDLSGNFTVFYNGPRCGASAPDHLHFQMAPRGHLPSEGGRGVERRLIKRRSGVSLFQVFYPGRTALLMEGTERNETETALGTLISKVKRVLGEAEEPMMNLICTHENGRWQITIFLRRKHRPDDYFREGEEQFLISPGAVDMGGLMVLAREKEFTTLSPGRARDILREVSLDEASWERLLDVLSVRKQK